MATGRTIIEAGLRVIGALATGQSMSAEEADQGLEALNALVSAWSAESLLVAADVQEEFTCVQGTAAYTLGDGATFDTQRPIEIKAASVKLVGSNQEIPVSVIGTESWAPIVDKSLRGTPDRLWPQAAAPNWTLNLYPVPDSALTLVLYSQKVLDSFPDLDTDVDLLDGFERALKFNFALEIAPEYSKNPNPFVMQQARDAKATIERMNKQFRTMSVDGALLTNNAAPGYNIYKGPTG